MPEPISLLKQKREQLRRAALERRAALSAAEIHNLSARIVAWLLRNFPAPPGSCVAFYWPIQNEPDLRAAAEIWRKSGAKLALPVVKAARAPLTFRLWRPDCATEADRYGIPVPKDTPEVFPDALCVPFTAFDGAGYRLGYGGGFYDRTLAALKPRPIAIGVGFELGRVENTFPGAHDERLDWIVTETGARAVR
ncbi:MAG: 5-formyltetrahydrofolate cyclo-ligase [Zoogloeaceae bacterium]|jgi:5,10-methenyltetrahydrofolate synthetase|nr:5-formyltetrahydrofolate cyclo-ligase [Zoogloeaceae bacterium]